MRKKIIVGLALLLGSQVGLAAINSAQSGDWASTDTWGGGVVPVAGDTVYVNSHSVTSSASVGTLIGLAVQGNGLGELIMDSGSSIGVSGSLTLNAGDLNVKSGAALTHASATGYILLTAAAGAAGDSASLTIDGGTVTSGRVALFGGSAATGAAGTLTINSGSLEFFGQRIQCDAGVGSTIEMFVNGGSLTCSYIQFKNTAAGAQNQSLTVDGGDLILDTSNQNGSLAFTDAGAKVWFEDGSITFEGCTAAEFSSFQTTFNAWVDSGTIDSVTFTDAELKYNLIHDGSYAVLTTAAPATTVSSVASGSWSTESIWSIGIAPRSGDVVYIKDDDVSVENKERTFNVLALIGESGGTGSLSLGDGALFAVSNDVILTAGELTVGTGASLSHTHVGPNKYIKIARDADSSGSLVVDGGSVYTERALFLSNWEAPGSTGTLTVNAGSLKSDKQLILGGASNSVQKVYLNGGTTEFWYIDFDQNDNHGNGTQTQDVTISGGDLILTEPSNLSGTLQFGGSYSSLFFEHGSITWTGCDAAEFSAFESVFDGWVDDGNVTSIALSAQQLKDALIHDGTSAVLSADQLPPSLSMSFDADSLTLASADLWPGATNILQTTTDLVDGSWSNLTSSTGSSSNTWVITPLTDPQQFYRIIPE